MELFTAINQRQSCRDFLDETVEKDDVQFLKTTPVIIVVTGDKTKSGVDIFQEEGPVAYQHACAAAIQNMLLASHALGFESVWFTLFDKKSVKELLNIDNNNVPMAFVCLGKSTKEAAKAPRKPMTKKRCSLIDGQITYSYCQIIIGLSS